METTMDRQRNSQYTDHRAVSDARSAFWATVAVAINRLRRSLDHSHLARFERRQLALRVRALLSDARCTNSLKDQSDKTLWIDRARRVTRANASDLERWRDHAHQVSSALALELRAERSDSFAKWVKEKVDTGKMKQLYHWTKDTNEVPLNLYITGGNTAVNAPRDISDAVAKKWSKVWGCDAGKAEAQRRAVASFRTSTRQVGRTTRFTVTDIRLALKSFDQGTAIGADSWCFKLLSELPDEALALLAEDISLARDLAVVPCSAILPLMAAIPKKTPGDTRTIGILSSWYRIDAKCDYDCIRAWDKANGHNDDSAKPGSSAAHAAFSRALHLEMAKRNDSCSATLLWDLTKFFDLVVPSRLAQFGRDHNYPTTALAMALYGGLAPRRIVDRGGVSTIIINISLSFIPGCARAPSLARRYTVTPVTTVRQLFAEARLYQHVDDLSISIVGKCKQAVAEQATTAGIILHEELVKLEAVTSDKSLVTSWPTDIATAVAGALRRECKIKITATRKGIDLGVDVQSGTRNVSKQRERLSAAGKRAKRVKALVRAHRPAQRMIRPAVSSVQDYATTVIGMSPALVGKAQSNVAEATGLRAAGTPNFLAIEWSLGASADPFVS